MTRLSSNFTLMLKFFIPVFWMVFFGTFTGVVFLSDFGEYGDLSTPGFKAGLLIFLLSGIAVMAFTLMRLLRVEVDEHFVYITNYFKAARYPWHQVEDWQESRFLFLTLVTVTLRQAGLFGKKLRFVASGSKYKKGMEAVQQQPKSE